MGIYLNKIDGHKLQVDEFFKQYKEELMTEKDFRLLKGVFCNEDLQNEELQSIRTGIFRWNESDISSTHFIQSVPYPDTAINNESSIDKGKG